MGGILLGAGVAGANSAQYLRRRVDDELLSHHVGEAALVLARRGRTVGRDVEAHDDGGGVLGWGRDDEMSRISKASLEQ